MRRSLKKKKFRLTFARLAGCEKDVRGSTGGVRASERTCEGECAACVYTREVGLQREDCRGCKRQWADEDGLVGGRRGVFLEIFCIFLFLFCYVRSAGEPGAEKAVGVVG